MSSVFQSARLGDPAEPVLAECGALHLDESGLIAGANPRLLGWVGMELDDLVGRPIQDVLEMHATTPTEPGAAATDALLHGRNRVARPVAIGALDHGRTIAVFDLSPDSPFARTFDAGRTRGRRGQERLEILLAASVAFAGARSADVVSQLLADVTRRSFAASHVSVHLQRDGQFAQTAGENPLFPHWPANYQPTGLRTLTGGKVLVVRTPADAALYAPEVPIVEVFEAAGIHAALAAPITYKGASLGSMIVYFNHPRVFDEEAVPLAEALANQAAQALTRIGLEEAQRRDAMLDAVTALPGRRLFEDEIGRMIAARPSTLCMLFIDLDGFKRVNDELGHSTGDDLLRQVGARLEAIVREPDVVGRFGGDEFIAAASVDDADGAAAIAERIRAALAEPYDGLPHDIPVSASVGAVLVRDMETARLNVDQLIRAADHSMYDAKSAGGNRVEVTVYR